MRQIIKNIEIKFDKNPTVRDISHTHMSRKLQVLKNDKHLTKNNIFFCNARQFFFSFHLFV